MPALDFDQAQARARINAEVRDYDGVQLNGQAAMEPRGVCRAISFSMCRRSMRLKKPCAAKRASMPGFPELSRIRA